MNDLLALIQSRRSLRRYTDQPVARETLELVLEAGRWSPSAHNRQPWRFAVIQGVAQHTLAQAMGAGLRADLTRDGLADHLIEADTHRSYERLTRAAALIVVCLTMHDMDTYPDAMRQQHEHTMAVQSVAMAAQNMLLMAHSLSLGACWLCAPLFCAEVVVATLTLAVDWEPQGIIALGYPSQSRETTRASMETRVVWR